MTKDKSKKSSRRPAPPPSPPTPEPEPEMVEYPTTVDLRIVLCGEYPADSSPTTVRVRASYDSPIELRLGEAVAGLTYREARAVVDALLSAIRTATPNPAPPQPPRVTVYACGEDDD